MIIKSKRFLISEFIRRRHLFLTFFSVVFAFVFTTQIANRNAYDFLGRYVLITQNIEICVMLSLFGSQQKFGFFFGSKKLFIPFIYQTISYVTIVLSLVISIIVTLSFFLEDITNIVLILFLCFGKAFCIEILRPLFRFTLKENYYFILELSYIILAGISKNIAFLFIQNLEMFIYYTCLVELIFFLSLFVVIYRKNILKFSLPKYDYFFNGYQLMINNLAAYLWKGILNNLFSNFVGLANFGQYSIISRINDVGGNIRKSRFDIWIKPALKNFDNTRVQKIKYQLNFGFEIFILYLLGLFYMNFIKIPNFFESSIILALLLFSHFLWNLYYFEYIRINRNSNFKLILKIGIASKIILFPLLFFIPYFQTFIFPILNFFEILIILLIIKSNKSDE